MTTPNTTPMALTPERLKEIEERAKKATPGPWQFGGPDESAATVYCENPFVEGRRTNLLMLMWPSHSPEITPQVEKLWYETADFIAHSRTDIPDLLTHIAEQDKEIERLRGVVRVSLTKAKEQRSREALILDEDSLSYKYWNREVERIEQALSPKVGGGE